MRNSTPVLFVNSLTHAQVRANAQLGDGGELYLSATTWYAVLRKLGALDTRHVAASVPVTVRSQQPVYPQPHIRAELAEAHGRHVANAPAGMTQVSFVVRHDPDLAPFHPTPRT